MAILISHLDIFRGSFYEVLATLITDHGYVVGTSMKFWVSAKKRGDRLRPAAQIEEFRRAIEDARWQEFKFLGYEFTWSNKRKNAENVTAYSSDHHPILISADLNPAGGRRRRRGHLFQFEESWATSDECKEVIQDAWSVEN